MKAYELTYEEHTTPAVSCGSVRIPELEFKYAIRRRDGRLVFRTETLAMAEEIMFRLPRAAKAAA